MEVDSVRIIAILSMSYITTRIVKTYTSVTKISRVPVENQITTLRVVNIAIRFSPWTKNDNESRMRSAYIPNTKWDLVRILIMYSPIG